MLTDPPGNDQVEVSLFGPGKGESCVVHLGQGDWIVVDSCIDQRTRENSPLRYLRDLGVDVAKSVRLVVGTHAHDDHIAGIADVFDQCKGAFFVSSSALVREEFQSLMRADAAAASHLRMSSYREYRRVREIVMARGASNGLVSWKRALEQRTLWQRPESDHALTARVISVSPSDEAVSRSLTALAEEAGAPDTLLRLSNIDPNELAVALWVEVGRQSVLLGADLLIGPAGCGWQAVLASHHPRHQASLVKVAHHGAPNAHSEAVWSELLTPDPVGVLAPYRAGRTPRPSVEDVTRLCSLSQAVYATADARQPKMNRQQQRAAAKLGSLATGVRDPWGSVGHVRARTNEDGDWTITMSGPAKSLCS